MSDAFEGVEFYIHPSCIAEGSEIGRGGFGVVLQGLLKEDGQEKQVALKCPLPGAPEQQETLFVREVLDTISISQRCPNVIQCYGFSTTKSGQTCLVMQQYTGGTLHALLSEHLDDPLPPGERACIAKDVVEAVRQLHNQGIVAEDLKPGNVLLDDNRHAVLSDFGASKSLGSDTDVTATEEAVGTLFFLPPEKLRRDEGGRFHVGFHSDIWSLGVLLLQLACCNLWLPYGPGVDVSNVAAQLNVDRESPTVPSLPDMPSMQQLIQQCLQLQPSDRIQIDELAQGVAGVLSQVITYANPMDSETDSTGVPGQTSLDQSELERYQAEEGLEHPRIGSRSREPDLRGPISLPAQVVLRKLSSGHITELQATADAARSTRTTVIIDLCGLEFAGEMFSDYLQVPPGCTIRNGAIQIPLRAQIHIEDGDTSLANLKIEGILYYGFILFICGSSNVQMEGCSVEGGGVGTDSGAVCVEGPSKGVGSRLTAHSCQFNGTAGLGLVVSGKSEMATLQSCEISGIYSNIAVKKGGTGVLRDCQSNHSFNGFGLAVYGHGSSAVASGSSFSSSQHEHVKAWAGGVLELYDCQCKYSRQHGLVVADPGSSGRARGCSLSSNKRNGACARGGGRLELYECQCTDSGRSGLDVTDPGSSALAGGCSLSGNKHNGACTRGGGMLTLYECQCNRSRQHGMVVADPESSALASKCSITSNRMSNINVYMGKAELHECKVEDSEHGWGVKARGAGSSIAVDSGNSLLGNRRGSISENTASPECCQLM